MFIYVISWILLMGMVDGRCSNTFGTAWFCLSNNIAGVTSDVEEISINLEGNNLDLKSMSKLTKLRTIILSKGGFRVLKSSDFMIFPKLAKLEIENEYSQIKLEKFELTGMYNHFLNH